jgi:hypothetical protein
MKIAFYLNNLSFRGTTVATLDYAYYNEKILGNESIIIYPNKLINENIDINFSKRYEIAEKCKSNFLTIAYETNEEIISKLDELNCHHVYMLKAGFRDDVWFEGKTNLVHAVFGCYDPHGTYAYVSKWLSESVSNNTIPYVPHIVKLPKEQTENFREKYNITKDKIVIGRYGGFDQFDIQFVHNIISFVVSNDPKFVFMLVNTRKFIDHPNVLFLDAMIDSQEKTNFILSCDAMIHARSDGESFGLSIGEFLFHNKPVFSFGGGRDKNNVELLQKYGLIFNNEYELLDKIFKLKYNGYTEQFSEIVKIFSPENVMERFHEIFLRK